MKYLVGNSNGMLDSFDLFNDFFGDFGAAYKIPTVDVWEDENAFTLEAELSGYKQEEVRISVEKHVLTIASNKKSDNDSRKKYLIRERVYRSFERRFSLPDGIDEENITAEFKNGVLTIVLPKLPVEKPRKIEVKIG